MRTNVYSRVGSVVNLDSTRTIEQQLTNEADVTFGFPETQVT